MNAVFFPEVGFRQIGKNKEEIFRWQVRAQGSNVAFERGVIYG